MLRTILMLTGVLMAAFLLAACPADDDAPADATDRIEVTGTDALAFEPDGFTVPAGQEVTVELTAQDASEHTFVIEGADGDDEVVRADAGETATGTFTIDEAGTYTAFCDVPGHREAGQEATLEVVDEG